MLVQRHRYLVVRHIKDPHKLQRIRNAAVEQMGNRLFYELRNKCPISLQGISKCGQISGRCALSPDVDISSFTYRCKKICKRSRRIIRTVGIYDKSRKNGEGEGDGRTANANARNKGACRSEGIVKTARNEGRDSASEKDQWGV